MAEKLPCAGEGNRSSNKLDEGATMTRLLFATVFPILLMAVSRPGEAGQITYAIQNYPADQQGATLSGMITTDGAIGTLAATDILSWSWTITPPGGTPYALSSSDSGAEVFLNFGAIVIASPTAITVPSGLDTSDDASFVLGALDAQGNTVADLFYEHYEANNPAGLVSIYSGVTSTNAGARAIWLTSNPAMGGTDPWVIAQVATVPEPSSLTLAASAVACAIVFGLARQRKR
jgi:hypothetical protein